MDSLQRTSTLPLPAFQTERSARDPLPLNAPKETDRLEDRAKTQSKDVQDDRFEEYLNQSAITTVEKAQERSLRFDPAAEIAAASVYGQPNGGMPL